MPTKRRWDKALELRDVIIIGAGEAGTRAALELRAQGFDGRLALVGDERHLPYERPPLSKSAIVGESAALPAIGDAFRLDELRIERIVGVTAVSIERPERRVLQNGIAVTSTLRTSDPHIFAVGDCASFRHSRATRGLAQCF